MYVSILAQRCYLLLQLLNLLGVTTIFGGSLRLQQQRNLLLGSSSGFASSSSFLRNLRVESVVIGLSNVVERDGNENLSSWVEASSCDVVRGQHLRVLLRICALIGGGLKIEVN